MESWYVLDESTGIPRPSGPFTLEQLQGMVSAGSLVPESRVAAVGSNDWIPASRDAVVAALFRTVPPRSPELVMPLPAGGAFGPSAYNFSNALAMGWASFKSRWGAWVLLGLVWFGITVALALPQNILSFLGEAASENGNPQGGAAMALGGACIGLVLQVFIGLPLFAGTIFAAGRMYDGDTQLSNLFAGFRQYGQSLASGLLLMVVSIACVLVCYIPVLVFVLLGIAISGGPAGGTGAAMVLGASLGVAAALAIFIVLAGTVLMRIICAPAIAIDPAFGRPGVLEAFRISWRQTAGLGFSMLGLMIVAGLILVASIFLLCVGYILVGVPVWLAVFGAMYLLVHRHRMTARPAGF